MRSLIRTYAIEGRSKDGKPTGKFFLDFNGVKGVSKEVVQKQTSKKACRKKRSKKVVKD